MAAIVITTPPVSSPSAQSNREINTAGDNVLFAPALAEALTTSSKNTASSKAPEKKSPFTPDDNADKAHNLLPPSLLSAEGMAEIAAGQAIPSNETLSSSYFPLKNGEQPLHSESRDNLAGKSLSSPEQQPSHFRETIQPGNTIAANALSSLPAYQIAANALSSLPAYQTAANALSPVPADTSTPMDKATSTMRVSISQSATLTATVQPITMQPITNQGSALVISANSQQAVMSSNTSGTTLKTGHLTSTPQADIASANPALVQVISKKDSMVWATAIPKNDQLSSNNQEALISNTSGTSLKISPLPSTPQADTSSANPALLQVISKKDSIVWATAIQKNDQLSSNNSISMLHYSNSSTYNNQATEAAVRPLSTENIIASLTNLSFETAKLTDRSTTSVSIRHDITSQYFDSKIQQTIFNNEKQNNSQQFGGQGKTADSNQLLTQTTGAKDSSTDSNFSNSTSYVFSDKIAQPIADSVKPINSPLPTPVSEDNVLQQIIQKLRISTQLQESKLVLKLHPAELGELKIDIQLKGGSLNASIVTQSQQVREILEKNMPKLRSLLEQHGLLVGDISIKFLAETIADYNLFQEQFSREASTIETKKSHKSTISFASSLEKSVNDGVTTHNNVNVTI